jgi:hypothetical protein
MNPKIVRKAIDAICKKQQQISMRNPYGNLYSIRGICGNSNIVNDSMSLTHSLASSINKKKDIAVKLRSERLEKEKKSFFQ